MIICGVDEAGRGPLAGNVVAAAVILPKNHGIIGLNDSKKLSEKKREFLYSEIINSAIAYGIAEASVEEIEKINILQATFLAMTRAVQKLNTQPDKILIDGNKIPTQLLQLNYTAQAIVGGDAIIEEISAASILAKVTRDRQLLELDKLHPDYGFAKHKGYGTKEHLEKIKKYGAIQGVHRMSFAPLKNTNLLLPNE